MIYTEFRTWRMALSYRLRLVLSGFYGLFVFCVIIGIASLFLYCIRQVNAFFRRETIAACIITSILLLMSAGWCGTFIRERQRYVKAQHVADSLAYDLSKFTQMYGNARELKIEETVVNN